MAPEMIEQVGHDHNVDIWAVGVLVYELITGKDPFSAPANVKNQQVRKKQFKMNVLQGKLRFPGSFPALAKDLVRKILKPKPQDRLKITEILRHPWLNAEANQILIQKQKQML